MNIDGTYDRNTCIARDVRNLLDKYPMYAESVKMFAKKMAEQELEWFDKVPVQHQHDIVELLHDFLSMDRERRKFKEGSK